MTKKDHSCTDCKLNNITADKLIKDHYKCAFCGKPNPTVGGGMQLFCNEECYYKYRHMND